jgi:hypothetical protein
VLSLYQPKEALQSSPSKNISPNKDDGYFADGVQDEILNNLAKIAQMLKSFSSPAKI